MRWPATILIVTALLLPACKDAPPADTGKTGQSKTGAPAVKTSFDGLVVDVRSQQEWDDGHLDYATHIPVDKVTDEIAKHAKSKEQPIYLHCRSGGRAGRAKRALEKLGYTNVKNLGGLEDARKTLDPMVKPGK